MVELKVIVVFHKNFKRDFRKSPNKIKKQFEDRLRIFKKDGLSHVLKNHALKGKWEGYRSINVTGDIRAIFSRDPESAYFVAIDTHGNLYK